MTKAVIFDLGGVYFANGMRIFYEKHLKKLGVSIEDTKKIFTGSGTLGGKYRRGEITETEFWKKALKKLKLDIHPKKYAEKWHSCYKIIPGIKGLIRDLRKKGYTIIGLSNNIPERIDYLEKKYAFKEDFDYLYLSNEIGLSKPDLKFYKHTLKDSGFSAKDCVFVDDKERNLKPAKKLGIKGILFKDIKHLRKVLLK